MPSSGYQDVDLHGQAACECWLMRLFARAWFWSGLELGRCMYSRLGG